MIKIGDILGDKMNRFVQNNLQVGEVHKIPLTQADGITPKDGDASREKFFIILGFDNEGNVIGGVVINSNINYNLPPQISDYMLPVRKSQYPFLHHDSFINCSHIITANRSKFSSHTFRGNIDSQEMLGLIIGAVKESPTINKMQLKRFGI